MNDPSFPVALVFPLIAIGLFLMVYPPYARMKRRQRRRDEVRQARRDRRRPRQ